MWLLAVFNFRIRSGAVRSGELSHKFFKAYVGTALDRVVVVGRHFDNQFQVPILFFVTLIAFVSYDVGNSWTIGLAWAFVFTRLLHSVVHLGKNKLLYRVVAYGAGWNIILVLWIQLVLLTK